MSVRGRSPEAKRKEYLERLSKRADFLADRIMANTGKHLTWDKAEQSALRWAIEELSYDPDPTTAHSDDRFSAGPFVAKNLTIFSKDGYSLAIIPDEDEETGGRPEEDRANVKLLGASWSMLDAIRFFMRTHGESFMGDAAYNKFRDVLTRAGVKQCVSV